MKFNNITIRTIFVYAHTLVIIEGLASIHISGSHAHRTTIQQIQTLKKRFLKRKKRLKIKFKNLEKYT
jgi:hypothetical protein